MCNTIGIIEHGKLLAAGKVGDIMDKVRAVRELRLEVLDRADVAEEVLKGIEGLLSIDREGDIFNMQSSLDRVGIAALHKTLVEHGVSVIFLKEDQGSLEDVFLSVTQGGFEA